MILGFNPDADEGWLDRRLWILLSMTVLCPIAFLRRLDSLKWISYIALVAVVNLVCLLLSFPFLQALLILVSSS